MYNLSSTLWQILWLIPSIGNHKWSWYKLCSQDLSRYYYLDSRIGRSSKTMKPHCAWVLFKIEMNQNQNRNNKANANSVKVSKTNFTKGQLISKCPFGFIISTKIPTEKFNRFCPAVHKLRLQEEGGRWSKKDKSCKLSLSTPPYPF